MTPSPTRHDRTGPDPDCRLADRTRPGLSCALGRGMAVANRCGVGTHITTPVGGLGPAGVAVAGAATSLPVDAGRDTPERTARLARGSVALGADTAHGHGVRATATGLATAAGHRWPGRSAAVAGFGISLPTLAQRHPCRLAGAALGRCGLAVPPTQRRSGCQLPQPVLNPCRRVLPRLSGVRWCKRA